MKIKRKIFWTYLVLTIITTCNSFAKEKQLEAENRISQHRRDIEYSYANKIFKVRLRAAAEVKMLEVAQISKPNWADINEWANFAETVLRINGLECEPVAHFKTSIETPAERLAVALSRIAKRKNDILSRSELEVLKLENQKKYALTAESATVEKILREDGQNLKSESIKGLIISIVYSPDKPSAVVDNKIVHNGDIIHGASVIKIDKEKVVFEKNRNKWQQSVRQTPSVYWE